MAKRPATKAKRPVTKEVAYKDLTIDEALELLKQVRSEKGLFRGVGNETFDPRLPNWTFSVSMLEAANVELVSQPPSK